MWLVAIFLLARTTKCQVTLWSLGLLLPGNINTALLTECSVKPEQLPGARQRGLEKAEQALCQSSRSCQPSWAPSSAWLGPPAVLPPPPQDTQASRRLGRETWGLPGLWELRRELYTGQGFRRQCGQWPETMAGL